METPAVTTDSAPVEMKIPAGGPERHEYMMTGKLPAPKEVVETESDSSTEQDADAESSTAEVEEQPEEVETQPEETVAKPEKKRGAEARITELLAKVKALESKLEAQGTKETKAESSPAPKSAEPLKRPIRPKIGEYTTMDDFDKANEKYDSDLLDYARLEANQAVQEAEFKRELNAKIQDARKRYENFDDVAKPLIGKLTDGSIDKGVLDAIDDSPFFSDVLYVIGGTEESAADFIAKAKGNPRQAIKMIGAIEQIIHDDSRAEAAKSQPRDDKTGKFATDKKISKAPPPPTELSGTSGTPPDEVASAASRGDFPAFKAAANRRDLASRKG